MFEFAYFGFLKRKFYNPSGIYCITLNNSQGDYSIHKGRRLFQTLLAGSADVLIRELQGIKEKIKINA